MSHFWSVKKMWKCDSTCLSHCHRTCWDYAADLLWSGTVWGHNPGPPRPQSSGFYPQRRPLSWACWAASAGTGAGSCRTAAEGSGGSWRTGTALYPLFLMKTLDAMLCGIWWFTGFVLFVRQCVKVQVLISRAVTHSSKNFWRPFILSVICCALFRLKKGFLGGRSGSFVLQWEKKKYNKYSSEKTISTKITPKRVLTWLTFAWNLLWASVWATQTHCTSFSHMRSSW